MPKLVDPDQMNQGTEGTFDTTTKKLDLAIAGNLDDNNPGRSSGVTHQCIHSWAKEEWLATAGLRKIRYPFRPIFEAKFEWINGWTEQDAQTLDLIRDGGFRFAIDGREYLVLRTLGGFDNVADQAYYTQVTGFTATTTAFDKSGEVNEPIQIFDGVATDYRDFLKVYLREQGKLYSFGNLVVDQDLSALTFQAYSVPLTSSPDPNVSASDATIDSSAPYTDMRYTRLQGTGFTTWANSTVYPAGAVVLDPIRQANGSSNGTWWFTPAGGTSSGTGTADDTGVTDWESFAGEEQIGTEWFAFNRIMTAVAGTPTANEFYEWSQREERLTTDINDDVVGAPNQGGFGAVNGEVEIHRLNYAGDLITEPGVLIRGFDANDTNSIQFQDITVDGGGLDADGVPATSTARVFPFVSGITISFNDILQDDPDIETIFEMYYKYTQFLQGTDLAITSPSSNTATLTSSTTDFTTVFANGDYLIIENFPSAVSNGIFQVNGVPTATTMPIRKVTPETLVAESAGPNVLLGADPYDSDDAIVVQDTTPADISGQITAASLSFTYDYDNNVQGGRTAATDAPIVIMAQGTSGAQWVAGEFTITRSTGLNFPLNANIDEVYLNPA